MNSLGSVIPDRDRCKRCHGKKTVQEKKMLEVHVSPGMKEGQKITFAGEGDQEVLSALNRSRILAAVRSCAGADFY